MVIIIFFFFFWKIYFTEWYKVRVLQLLLVTVFSYEKSVVKKPTFERREIFDIFVSRILQLSVNYYLLLIIRSLLFQNFEIIKNAHSVYSSKCVWTTPNKLLNNGDNDNKYWYRIFMSWYHYVKVSKYGVFSGPYLDSFHVVDIFLGLLIINWYAIFDIDEMVSRALCRKTSYSASLKKILLSCILKTDCIFQCLVR